MTANNTSAANSFVAQTNGNSAAGSVSKLDVHSLLYSGATTKIYAHLLLWFGDPKHMDIGYSSTDSAQIHRQVTDMISRGINGVIIDWYGPNNAIDQATQLVMAEAQTHPGFTFAIMIDQGAIAWDSCPGCSPQQALINQLQYIEQTYFPSSAYMTLEGKPVVANFNVDSFSVDWVGASAALTTQPAFIFQDSTGFSHVVSGGSYSWIMPTTTDYGMSYLTSFYDAGMTFKNEQTVGATYKGFNDSLAPWGSNRIMSQQCGQTWLQTFSEINRLYSSANQLPALQLVTWNDYEEASEIESGIDNCLTVSASVSQNALQWSIQGDESTIDHYVPYISTDGQNLMSLGEALPGSRSVDLCGFSIPNGNYISYVQAVGKPSLTNKLSGGVNFTLNCAGGATGGNLTLGTNPTSLTIAPGGSGSVNVTVTSNSASFNDSVALTCSGLPANWSCSFAPASVTPGTKTATSVLTLLSAPLVAREEDHRNLLLASILPGFSFLAIAVAGKVQRRRLLVAVGACLLVALAMGAVSCGGGSRSTVPVSASGPVSNRYIVTVNGNAGSIQLSTTLSVSVK